MSGGSPYWDAILEHFRRPRNYGALPNATAEAEGSNPLCGDRVRVAIALDATGERIEQARFTANACAICVASASLLTERVHGMALTAVGELTDEEIIRALGGEIPDARRRCALLPLHALRRAVTASRTADRPRRRGGLASIVLAAGRSLRFGGQKLLAEVPNGELPRDTLVRLAVVLLQRPGIEHVLVVVGREGDRVRQALAGLDLDIVQNEAYADGMSTSLVAGVRGALERWPDAEGVLIALGDQPLTDDRVVPRLVETFAAGSGARIVAPRYRGERGNPVVFSRELVDELLAVTGDRGAREVIERDPRRVRYVDFDFPSPLDVDTPADLLRLYESLGTRRIG